MIELKNISKKINNREILKDVNLQLENSRIFGLLGPSGTGKSTLAKIIAGLIEPDSGEILFDGVPLQKTYRSFCAGSARCSVQMVYQQPYAVLDPSQKIRGGIKELLKYHKLFPPADIGQSDDYIDYLASELELEGSVLNHLPSQISGGEAQRVAILKCLLLKPGLIILDEATSMLDVSIQANILACVKNKQLSRGGSILMITHDHGLAEAYCDIIYELDPKSRTLVPGS